MFIGELQNLEVRFEPYWLIYEPFSSQIVVFLKENRFWYQLLVLKRLVLGPERACVPVLRQSPTNSCNESISLVLFFI